MENGILSLLQKVGDVALASLCVSWVESSVVDVEAWAEMTSTSNRSAIRSNFKRLGWTNRFLKYGVALISLTILGSLGLALCSKAGMQSLLSLSYSFSQILMLHEIHCWVFLGTLKGILSLCYPNEFRIVCTCMLQPMLTAASSSSSSGGFRDCKNWSKLMGKLGSFCMD